MYLFVLVLVLSFHVKLRIQRSELNIFQNFALYRILNFFAVLEETSFQNLQYFQDYKFYIFARFITSFSTYNMLFEL